MVSRMAVFRYLNPFWWAYAVTFKPVLMLLKWVFSLPLKALKATYPRSFLGKMMWWPAAIWVAIPGTVPLSVFFVLSQFGLFTEEYEAAYAWVASNGPAIAENVWVAAKIAWAVAYATYQATA